MQYSTAAPVFKLICTTLILVALWQATRRVLMLSPGSVKGMHFDGLEHILEVVPGRRLQVVPVWTYCIPGLQIMACRHVRKIRFLVVFADSLDVDARRQLCAHLQTVRLTGSPQLVTEQYPRPAAEDPDNQG